MAWPDKNNAVVQDTNNINSNSHDIPGIVLSVLHNFSVFSTTLRYKCYILP